MTVVNKLDGLETLLWYYFGRGASAKNEKLRYIAFFPSETQILNFLSQCFS